eukprot:comp21799_c0_seq1/m.30998 comp21799_c0_seq1/g.30998  ORF comp21799_c0_seq1/g.30998 comp21799_c0_seq1/m.30998 type:complete len:1068 (-) comp21799_c0_seq1:384-3587(-)
MEDEDLFAVFAQGGRRAKRVPTETAAPQPKRKKQDAEPVEPSPAPSEEPAANGTQAENEAPAAPATVTDGVKDDASIEKDGELNGGGARVKISEQVAIPRILPAVIKSSMITGSRILDTETTELTKHQVAVPEGYNYVPLSEYKPPAKQAKEYKFTLDPFQAQAVKCLERQESVLVSAHTSAGKTVVAEYAIAMALRDKQRVVYTTPIKALSNQKFREFQEEFGDVGLMTGDVTISPNSSVLVMTTEILRSMLYRGSEVLREVAWVIYDEVHYMRDKERGVVWEETLILLPDNVHYVFLSATIPNAIDFAQWICQLHNQPCHVVYTDYRPTPLQHFLFPSGGDGIFLVVDEKGNFREDNFNKAMAKLGESNDNAPKSAGGKGSRPGPKNSHGSDIFKIVKMIMEKELQPCIVFSFSKRECEAHALQMSKLDFNNEDEKKGLEAVFNNAMESLSEEDRRLPQVENIAPLLKRGIGIHHGGLLPILKEVIEILFQEGLIKVLFATETFAMGLNMPARTVVFTGVRKFDGKEMRWVSGGEYIQMSGRAGRRGKDDKGLVIQMVDEKMEPSVAMSLLKGEADKLNSAFHVTYNMLLNLLRVEELTPEFMLERSFFQFQHRQAIPALEAKMQRLVEEKNSIVIADEKVVAELYLCRSQLDKLRASMLQTIRSPQHVLRFLQPGRLVKVVDGEEDWGWGCVLNFQKKFTNKKGPITLAPDPNEVDYVVDVCLTVAAASKATGRPRPPREGEKADMQVVPIVLNLLDSISSVRIFVPNDVSNADSRKTIEKSIKEVKARFKGEVPLLDPIEDMNIKDANFKDNIKKTEYTEKKMMANAVMKMPAAKRDELYTLYLRKVKLEEEIAAVRREIKKCSTILQNDDLRNMKRVLRRLGFTTASDVIEMKGRVACEISTGDELVLTELIFNGVFNDLSVEQVSALLACFVFQEKADEVPKVKEDLAGPLRQLQETARRIARVAKDSRITLDEEEYVGAFTAALMDVVYAWSKGSKFGDICKMTDIFEGSIIRGIRREEELLRQLVNAAKAIGNTDLEQKFSEGIHKLKRDIVFAASLYL